MLHTCVAETQLVCAEGQQHIQGGASTPGGSTDLSAGGEGAATAGEETSSGGPAGRTQPSTTAEEDCHGGSVPGYGILSFCFSFFRGGGGGGVGGCMCVCACTHAETKLLH